jgi:hypothetical protein
MTKARYRDKDLEGYADIELELEQEVIDILEERAILEDKTVDEVIEDILIEMIRDWEVDDSLE